MQVTFATVAGDPAIPNEDFVVASPDVVVVVDGVTPLDRSDTGCRHGVAWYARTLGTRLFSLAGKGSEPLTDCLAAAIAETRDAHGGGCDPAHPDSPAATVAVVRLREGTLEHLVLSDAAIVVDTGGEPRLITDNRAGQVGRRLRADGIRPTGPVVRARRNQPGGYWVAAERPESAYEALTGESALSGVRTVVAATDGATRLVDTFGWGDWRDALEALRAGGPHAWIAQTRAAERADAGQPAGQRRTTAKVHDDATLALLRIHGDA
ncbi:protein phosphatase 2C domain-containing protein [Actinopolymorpha sp. B17G11]|uniref:protein phosphatase 2C domain-containing protein n=1 Tax=unclassified Actinopolymorpha TaxID=2627063 RepID=UPI0032D984FC